MQETTFILAKRIHPPDPSTMDSIHWSRLLAIRLLLLHVCVFGLSMVFIDPPTMAPLGSLIVVTMLGSIITCRVLFSTDYLTCQHADVHDQLLRIVSDRNDLLTRSSAQSNSKPDLDVYNYLDESIVFATRNDCKATVYSLSCTSPKHPVSFEQLDRLGRSLSCQFSSSTRVFHSREGLIRILSTASTDDRFSYRLAHRLMLHCQNWLDEAGVLDAVVTVGFSQFPEHGRQRSQLIALADSVALRPSTRQVSRCTMATLPRDIDMTNVIALPVVTDAASQRQRVRALA